MLHPSSFFSGIAHEAGLGEEEGRHFTAGIAGYTDEPLELPRDLYTHLQKILEIKEVERARKEHAHSMRIGYSTPRPLTPLYQPEHPRHDVVRDLFGKLPMALSVISAQVLREICESGVLTVENREAIAQVVRSIPHSMGVFSMSNEPVERSYMAMSPIVGEEAVAFEADQNDGTTGRVIFGNDAIDMYMAVRDQHERNLDEGRNHELLLGILDNPVRRAA